VHMLAGQGGCDPVGHGTLTLYDRRFRGGNIEEDEPEPGFGLGEILARYA